MQEVDPNHDRARSYVESADAADLAAGIADGNPWYFEQQSLQLDSWAAEVLALDDLAVGSSLHLVGSGAIGFSLAPAKAGAGFRPLSAGNPSDLDFALVSESFFLDIWNEIVSEDAAFGSWRRQDSLRVRVYWGRIDQHVLPKRGRVRVRSLVDSIRREEACRGHKASVRVYRRREDLIGYSTWCIDQVKKVVVN